MPQHVPNLNPFNLPSQPELPSSGAGAPSAPVASEAEAGGGLGSILGKPGFLAALEFAAGLLKQRPRGTSPFGNIVSSAADSIGSFNARGNASAERAGKAEDRSLSRELTKAQIAKLKKGEGGLSSDTARAELDNILQRTKTSKAQEGLTAARTKNVGKGGSKGTDQIALANHKANLKILTDTNEALTSGTFIMSEEDVTKAIEIRDQALIDIQNFQKTGSASPISPAAGGTESALSSPQITALSPEKLLTVLGDERNRPFFDRFGPGVFDQLRAQKGIQ